MVLQPHQFSWTSQDKWLFPTNIEAFLKCLVSIKEALEEEDFTDGSLYYHLESIHPWWADEYQYVATFGSHKFYKEKNNE